MIVPTPTRESSPSNGTLSPEEALIAAVLTRAIRDAQGDVRHVTGVHAVAGVVAEAQAFLADATRVGFFCDLLGADVDRVLPTLQRAVATGRAPR